MLAITDDMRRRAMRRLIYRFPWLYGMLLRWACRRYESGMCLIRDMASAERPRTVVITSGERGRAVRYIIDGYEMSPEDLGHLTAVHRLKRELESIGDDVSPEVQP